MRASEPAWFINATRGPHKSYRQLPSGRTYDDAVECTSPFAHTLPLRAARQAYQHVKPVKGASDMHVTKKFIRLEYDR